MAALDLTICVDTGPAWRAVDRLKRGVATAKRRDRQGFIALRRDLLALDRRPQGAFRWREADGVLVLMPTRRIRRVLRRLRAGRAVGGNEGDGA